MAKNLRKPKIGVKIRPRQRCCCPWLRCGRVHIAAGAGGVSADAYRAAMSAVRPMACMAAAVGAAVSAAVLARRLQKRLLLCGLGCGAFYAVCLLAATLLANGRLDWQGSNAMLPLALLLGGLLGGALTALRAGR